MPASTWRIWQGSIDTPSLQKDVFLSNATYWTAPIQYNNYPAKRFVDVNRVPEYSYTNNVVANKLIQHANDKKFDKEIAEINKNMRENNKEKYQAQIEHIVQWQFPTNDIGLEINRATVSNGNSLDEKQRRSLSNYQNSWARAIIPEWKEFLAGWNWINWQIKKYLIKDGYIYEIEIDTDKKWNIYRKANKYVATKDNLDSLQNGYDIIALNNLLDRARNDEKWKAIFGKNVTDALPFKEIKLTNKVN